MKVTFMTPPVKDLVAHDFGTGQIAEERLWLSEKAAPYTKDKIILFADKLGVRPDLDSIMETVTNDEEYVKAVTQVLRNKPGSFIFGGEEIAIEDKDTGKMNIWVKPTLYPYGAIASVEDFGILEEKCEKLHNNNKLIKRLDVIQPSETSVSKTETYDNSYDAEF